MLTFRGIWSLSCSMVTCAIILLLGSCTSAKRINYFNDIRDSVLVTLPPVEWESRVIQIGDVIDVIFSAKEEDAVRPFNKQVSTASIPASPGVPAAPLTTPAPTSGYKVGPDGTIQLPIIGNVLVVGKTTNELKDSLTSIVKVYMKDPRVDVKFNSFRITLLGEVRSPGTYFLPGEHPTIFDALAAAGDLPTSARKYNVELYRDYNGSRTISKVDLTNSKILNDPSKFQIKPNDVLYVRTRKSTIAREDFGLFSSIVTLALTVVTLGITISNN